MKTTTVRIDAARREDLKDAAFKISMETREMYTMTEVLKYLIDNHCKDAIKGLIEKHKEAS